jgi:hypothetical protein
MEVEQASFLLQPTQFSWRQELEIPFIVPFSILFNVVSWARVIGQVDNSCESVETISNCNIQSFTKNAVSGKRKVEQVRKSGQSSFSPLLRISNHLRVASTDIKNDWILRTGDGTGHLDI